MPTRLSHVGLVLSAPVMAIVMAAVMASQGASAQPASTRWHRHLAGPASHAPAHEAAQTFLWEHGAALGLDPMELVPSGRVLGWRGHRVVRFAQYHDGLPVFGRGVVIRLDGAGRVRTLAATVAPELDVIPLAPVDAAEASRAAWEHWGTQGAGHPTAVLGVMDNGAKGELLWRVEGNLARGRVLTMVDAVTGEVRLAASLSRHSRGLVYEENPVATPEPVEVDMDNLAEDASTLTGRAATVWRYVSGSLQNPESLVLEQLATDDGSGFFYEPRPNDVVYDDPFAEVNLYYHVDRIDSYFREVHGHIPVRSLTVVANYTDSPGVPYNNAFSTQLSWQEHGLFFGQGSGVDFAYDGDVVYHEFGHFVVDEVSQMGYLDVLLDEQGMHFGPGGIHEGLADYFSATLTGDALVGEYSMRTHARSLENDFRCPDQVMGEPHEDGRIIGGVTWAVREALGSPELADDLVFGALTMLSSKASFQDFGTALLDTAELLEGEGAMTQAQRETLAGIITTRGIDNCDRVIELVPGVDVRTQPFGFDWLARIANSECETLRVLGIWLPGPFQYRIEVPAEAQTLQVRVRHDPDDRLLFRVLLRREEPVAFSVSPVVQGLNVVFARHYDHDFGEYEQADETVTLTTADPEPLVPGSTYYVAFLHQNCPDTQMRILADTSTDLPVDPDAGVGPIEEGGRCGCACASTPGSPSVRDGVDGLIMGLVWLLVPLVILCRRRRRDQSRKRR